MDECMDSYIVSLETIASKYLAQKSTQEDDSIQLSCCANERFKQCVMENAKSRCEKVARKFRRINSFTSAQTTRKLMNKDKNGMMKNLESMLDSMALTGPEFVCRNLKKNFCAQKFVGKYDIKLRRPKNKSILPSMMQIYSNRG